MLKNALSNNATSNNRVKQTLGPQRRNRKEKAHEFHLITPHPTTGSTRL